MGEYPAGPATCLRSWPGKCASLTPRCRVSLAPALPCHRSGNPEGSSMNITEHTTVAEIASTLPASVRVFQRHGVDFCCGGRRPLAVVCAEQGVSFAEMARDIQTAAAIPPADARDWTAASLASLIDHIIATYHDVLRTELPRLDTLAAKAAQAHVSRAPFLVRVAAIVGELSGELRDHMANEETVLFPAIRAVEVGHAFDA